MNPYRASISGSIPPAEPPAGPEAPPSFGARNQFLQISGENIRLDIDLIPRLLEAKRRSGRRMRDDVNIKSVLFTAIDGQADPVHRNGSLGDDIPV